MRTELRAALGLVLVLLLGACPPAGGGVAAHAPVLRLLYETAAATKLSVDRSLLAPKTVVTAKTELDWQIDGGTLEKLPNGGAKITAAGPFTLSLVLPATQGIDYVLKASTNAELTLAAQSARNPEDEWEGGVVTKRRDGFEYALRVATEKPSIDIKVAGKGDATLLRLDVRETLQREPVQLLSSEDAALRAFVRRRSPTEEREREVLLAAGASVYEWPLLPATEPRVLDFDTLVVKRHGDDDAHPAPLTSAIDVHRRGAWERAFSVTRGGAGDDGDFRFASVPLDGADAIRLTTEAAGKPPVTVGWARAVVRPAVRPTRLPDVLIFTADALRADKLGAYGSTEGLSPKLDALARESVIFDEARTARGETWESLTGIAYATFPEDVGVAARGGRVRHGSTAIADVFAGAGYFTARLGNATVLPGQLGTFDVSEDQSRDVASIARFEQLLAEQKDRPKFIWVHLAATHYPYHVVKEHVPPGQPADLDPKWFFDVVRDRKPADLATVGAWADAGVRQVDAQVGALLPALQAADRPGGPAIFLFSADHGSQRGEQGLWFMHGSYHRAVLRIPFLLSWPGHLTSRRVPQLVRSIDFGPTLLDLVGLPHEQFTGKSLVPLTRGEKMTPLVNMVRDDFVRLIETDEYKAFGTSGDATKTWQGSLITMRLPDFALYRWREDPGEEHDLSMVAPLVAGELLSHAVREDEGSDHAAVSSAAVRLLRQAGYAGDH